MDEDEGPLRSEALARDKWRGEDEAHRGLKGGGHTLPASEDDDERMGTGSEDEAVSHPRTMPPPD